MKKIKLIVIPFIILSACFSLFAQGQTKVVQMTGIVVGGDSLYGIPNASVYIPKSGRGTNTNYYGFFSLPVLPGDTVVCTVVGFRKKSLKVPDTITDKMSVVFRLQADTFLLPVVEIFPWSTEQLFKQAFLALELPEKDQKNLNKNLNEQVLKRMLYTSSASAAENNKYYMEKQMQTTDNRYVMVTPGNVLLNPFAWARVIKDAKEGRFKSNFQKRSYDEDE